MKKVAISVTFVLDLRCQIGYITTIEQQTSESEMDSKHLTRAIDSHVGRRVRARRRLMGLSQTQLGSRIGVGFQQVQKYESGANRVSSGTLCRIAEALDAPIAFFFDGREGGYRRKPVGDGRADRLQIEVARNFAEIKGRSARRAVADLVRALVSGEATDSLLITRSNHPSPQG